MTLTHVLLLAVAGFAAGAINSVAGGGSLVSFPALLAIGTPALTANATNLIAVTPGYVSGTVGYRPQLAGQSVRVRRLGAAVMAGSVVGSAILLLAPASAFDAVAPFCVLAACALLVAQPRLARARAAQAGGGEHSPALLLVVFLGGIYGGYFGAGLGIMLLALLAVFVQEDLQRLNALKGVLSLLVSIVAAVLLAVFGPVDWVACAVIAAGSLVGGRLGVGVARRLPPQILRYTVAAYGTIVAVVLLVS
ncbi:MAG: hypothetical protein JWN65_3182 [Solirubrobacterales bacterium]|nr:hypothetical protein [Solirubrobacterales bacterium]